VNKFPHHGHDLHHIVGNVTEKKKRKKKKKKEKKAGIFFVFEK
jgi:hypothetical protein